MSDAFPVIPDPRFRISSATSNQTVFAVAFPFLGAGEVSVVKIGLDLVQTTLARPADYTITGAGSPSGGTVTLKKGAKAGEQLLFIGAASRTRASSVTRGGKFSSAAIDEDLDRLTLIAQEHDRELGRAPKSPYGITPPLLIPGAAGTVAVWDADGDLAEGPDSDALNHLATALAVDAGRALIYPAAPAAAIYDAGSRKIANVTDGTAPGDAATKGQLDALAASVDVTGIDARFDAVETSVALGWTTGDCKLSMSDDDQAGWLRVDARTIGNGSSGATSRANDDTHDLFVLIWTKYSNTLSVIQTSAGANTVRGASAAADWAANRRLPLIAVGGEFLRFLDGGRGIDAGRVLGSAQAQQILNHIHNFAGTPVANHSHGITGHDESDSPAGNNISMSNSTGPTGSNSTAPAGGHTPAGTIGNPTANNGAENRTRNIAFPLFVKL